MSALGLVVACVVLTVKIYVRLGSGCRMCSTYSKDMSALCLVVACVVFAVKICPPWVWL